VVIIILSSYKKGNKNGERLNNLTKGIGKWQNADSGPGFSDSSNEAMLPLRHITYTKTTHIYTYAYLSLKYFFSIMVIVYLFLHNVQKCDKYEYHIRGLFVLGNL
jgi:hypothetical protein